MSWTTIQTWSTRRQQLMLMLLMHMHIMHMLMSTTMPLPLEINIHRNTKRSSLQIWFTIHFLPIKKESNKHILSHNSYNRYSFVSHFKVSLKETKNGIAFVFYNLLNHPHPSIHPKYLQLHNNPSLYYTKTQNTYICIKLLN